MKLNYVKDVLFDLINECGELPLSDLSVDEDVIFLLFTDGTAISLTCKAEAPIAC